MRLQESTESDTESFDSVLPLYNQLESCLAYKNYKRSYDKMIGDGRSTFIVA